MNTEYTGPRIGDAMGLLLRDANASEATRAKGKHVREFYDGYLSIVDTKDLFRRPLDWPDETWWGYERIQGDVLDLSVGAGRFAVPLQDDGLAVAGLDISPGAVEVAKLRGVTDVTCGDLNEVASIYAPRRFDTVLLLGMGLLLLRSPDKAGATLRQLHQVTARDAKLIGEGAVPDVDSPRGKQLAANNLRAGLWPGQQRARVRYQDVATPWSDLLYASASDLARLTLHHGWRLAAVKESQGNTYVAEFHRMDTGF
ncbi:class I SAM-dependent methyltransferase [Amycolatopsis sp. NPDC059657]|uniref:class I SAM-dependent methyltransferase n=1 Tax=Amycolatopsis sp. NPDC059657 TaxID=3346899 RepID=UPI00366BCDA7